MREITRFYIGGEWVEPVQATTTDVVDPATEEVVGHVALGGPADVYAAVEAARAAFAPWSRTPVAERVEILQAIIAGYQERMGDLAAAVTAEMGAPAKLAAKAQVPIGLGHLMTAAKALGEFAFVEERGASRIVKEPVGVCGFITPWNWPLNQVLCKVAPALATGCTMVLKPSEEAPFSAAVLTEIIDAAGVPAGVFNLVNGDGPGVGTALAAHPGIDMISFTGSTRAGVEVAKTAAPTVKRVAQELGGKSPNILLDDDDLAANVAKGVTAMMVNSGQSCNAPTRMIVPAARLDEVTASIEGVAERLTVGAPDSGAMLGPVVNRSQFEKIQGLIERGLDEGATAVIGGPGRPDGLDAGFYVRPTVFTGVTNDMDVARTEIFGPVLVVIGYDDLDQAVEIGNDTEYGLAGYVSGRDLEQVQDVASRLRVGTVAVNSAPPDTAMPFGGYKRSGNGREWGDYAFDEFLEVKSILGYSAS